MNTQREKAHLVHRDRSGFTLIETLVALALLGLIMGSVSTSLNLYWKHRAASQQWVGSSQIFRGLLEDLVTDLRSASPATTAGQNAINFSATGPGSPAATAFHGSEQLLKVQEQFLNLATSDEKRPIHFAGTSTWISFLTMDRSSRFDDAIIAGPDQRSHVIWWNNRSSISVPFALSGPRKISGSVPSVDAVTGAARSVRDFSSEAISTALVSARVSSVGFRYFDGSAWRQQWDSSESHQLPRAIEVSISMDSEGGSPDVSRTLVIDLPQGG